MKRIFRTINTKYMIIFMSLFIFTVFVIGALIATIVSNYSIDKKMEQLSTSNILFKTYYQGKDDKQNCEEYFRSTEQELEKMLNVIFLNIEDCQIIVADNQGRIIMHSYRLTGDGGAALFYFSDVLPNVNMMEMNRLSKETMSNIKHKGDISMNNSCNGLFNDRAIWFASVLESHVGETEGFIISFQGDIEKEDIFDGLIRTIVFTALWLLVAMLVAIYVVSYKVMTPLREIGNAARSFAHGRYDVRVRERGDDEVAELAKSFNKMAIEIQSKDNMQKQFLSNASHDLRTPMTTIAGFIDGILDGAIPPERHEYYLGIIKSEIQRLSRLVTSLLDVSRLQSGERKFDKKQFNICEMARQTIISFENQFNQKNLDVEFEVDDYDMMAFGDKDAINQVIYNLCHNAIKFSYTGAKYKVSISDTGNEISFSVYNEGIGIAKEELPFVFDRFYKSDKSRGLDKTGVGLGLFISKTIIDSHSGEMTVNSEYEKWCEFTFTLPKGE